MKPAWILLLLFAWVARAAPTDARMHVLSPPAEIRLPSNVRVYFSPGDSLEGAVVAALNQASVEILISQFAITSKRIEDAIVRAFGRKVVVGIILQETPPILNYQTPAFFDRNGIPYVYAATGRNHRQSYGIIDRRVVLTGSYDWTSSTDRTNEDLVAIDEPGIAAAYVRNWLDTAREAKIPDR
jgi:cardiolipin hydrolase